MLYDLSNCNPHRPLLTAQLPPQQLCARRMDTLYYQTSDTNIIGSMKELLRQIAELTFWLYILVAVLFTSYTIIAWTWKDALQINECQLTSL